MKTFDERRESVHAHMQQIVKRRRRMMASVTSICLVLAILGTVLFVPLEVMQPRISMYADSDYYTLIQRLHEATYQKPVYKNNFEKLMNFGVKFDVSASPMPGSNSIVMDAVAVPNGAPAATMAGAVQEPAEEYVEVTDNQVSGVIEADLFKRSDRYAFYLRGHELSVYSIAGADSRLEAQYQVVDKNDQWGLFHYYRATEMYLSQDCKTITILVCGYREDLGTCTVLVNLDVSDVANIRQTNRILFTGYYVSSRMVGDQILLTYNYNLKTDEMDYSEPSTFVPQYGTPDGLTCVPSEEIVCPETVSATRYTVVSKIDVSTLAVAGTAALLSYSEDLYVSEDTIYATRSYSAKIEEDDQKSWKQADMTEITGIRYDGLGLEVVGSVALEGSLKDQYSMDQHNGILRVVASTSSRLYTQRQFEDEVYYVSSGLQRNVNLYCVDLTDWTVVASVIEFAPWGEDAQSVRFDGDQAYVCTAEVVTLTDPVYFFDLSDIHNITYKDTGTIEGYSTSLINLGDGYLLGIGYGSSTAMLKIEVYEETEYGVISVCAYERQAVFSEEYKSYLVDREHNLIGLQVADSDGTGNRPYLLLHFDGYELNLLHVIKMNGALSDARAFLAEGYLYVFTSDGFAVRSLA